MQKLWRNTVCWLPLGHASLASLHSTGPPFQRMVLATVGCPTLSITNQDDLPHTCPWTNGIQAIPQLSFPSWMTLGCVKLMMRAYYDIW